jgi:antitoxin component of MazEF toxin-antitoxin module
MIKRLSKHGNSMALVLDRGLLDLLDIKPESSLKLTTDGECLVVSPVHTVRRRAAFAAALKEGKRRYAKTLKDLAG